MDGRQTKKIYHESQLPIVLYTFSCNQLLEDDISPVTLLNYLPIHNRMPLLCYSPKLSSTFLSTHLISFSSIL